MKKFKNKSFLFNPQCTDGKSFLYSLAYGLYEGKLKELNPKKVKIVLKKYVKLFNIKNIDFPCELDDIKRFLRKNSNLDCKLNILYRNNNDEVFPYEFGLGNGSKVINILFVYTFGENGGCKPRFLYIKNIHKYLRKVYNFGEKNVSYRRIFYCANCLNSFSTQKTLDEHEALCQMHKPMKEYLPEDKKSILKFKNVENQEFAPLIAFLDFECILPKKRTTCEQCRTFRCKCDASFTDNVSDQLPIGYNFLVFENNRLYHSKTYIGKNASDHFIEHLNDIEENVYEALRCKQDMIFNFADKKRFDEASKCYLCEKDFSDTSTKVRDHSHHSGIFLGAACNDCNLRRRRPNRLKIYIHNGSR